MRHLPLHFTMDADKCVALRNKIFMHGWLGSGKSIEDFERNCTTWFGYHNDEAEVLRDAPSLILAVFPESAYVAVTVPSLKTCSVTASRARELYLVQPV
jgi:hypothetical protein